MTLQTVPPIMLIVHSLKAENRPMDEAIVVSSPCKLLRVFQHCSRRMGRPG